MGSERRHGQRAQQLLRNRIVSDRIVSCRIASDQIGSHRSGSDRIGADRIASDRIGSERIGGGRGGAAGRRGATAELSWDGGAAPGGLEPYDDAIEGEQTLCERECGQANGGHASGTENRVSKRSKKLPLHILLSRRPCRPAGIPDFKSGCSCFSNDQRAL